MCSLGSHRHPETQDLDSMHRTINVPQSAYYFSLFAYYCAFSISTYILSPIRSHTMRTRSQSRSPSTVPPVTSDFASYRNRFVQTTLSELERAPMYTALCFALVISQLCSLVAGQSPTSTSAQTKDSVPTLYLGMCVVPCALPIVLPTISPIHTTPCPTALAFGLAFVLICSYLCTSFCIKFFRWLRTCVLLATGDVNSTLRMPCSYTTPWYNTGRREAPGLQQEEERGLPENTPGYQTAPVPACLPPSGVLNEMLMHGLLIIAW